MLCSWPNGGRPRFPFPYSDEVWTGVEYHVAAELIYDGWVDQAMEIVEAVQSRHDGVRRSPWDEVECGHHYARTMSSWALLLALSGQQVDAATGAISFDPKFAASTVADRFQCFWSNGRQWGVLHAEHTQDKWSETIEVLG